MEDEDDAHFCLRCKTKIYGLENYIVHRQQNCSTVVTENIINESVVSNDCPDTIKDASECNASDFFTSLQLKSNYTTKSVLSKNNNQNTEYCLNDFDTIDGDSEISDIETDKYPPKSHTGGKWEPGSRPELTNELRVQKGVNDYYVNYADSQISLSLPKTTDSINTTKSPIIVQCFKEQPVNALNCKLCNIKFESEKAVALHQFEQEHKNKFQCINDWAENVSKYQIQSVYIFPYQCCICSFYVLTEDLFIEHLSNENHFQTVSTVRRPLLCICCQYDCNSNSDMLIHIKTLGHSKLSKETLSKHPVMIVEKSFRFSCKYCNGKCELLKKQKLQKCPYCDFTENSQSVLKYHVFWTHKQRNVGSKKHQTTLNCSECQEKFKCTTSLKTHFFKLHSEKTCICETCNRLYIAQSDLERHKLTKCHRKKEMFKNQENENTETEKLKCNLCNYSTTSRADICIHKAQHCGPLRKSKDEKLGRLYKCTFCRKTFTLSSLKIHIYTHTGERPFTCHICKKSFTQKGTLQNHSKLHQGVKSLMCNVCPFSTTRKTILQQHKYIHEPNQTNVHLCHLCDASFYHKAALLRHTAGHSGKPKHPCSFYGCQRSFRTSKALASHTLVHENKKTYLCDTCGYSTGSTHLLTKHQRQHTGEKPFKCNHCHYRSTSSSNVLRHLRLHSGSKPYKCPYCEYRCNTQENIRKHILKTKKHAGKKVYPCKHCEFGCNDFLTFKTHMIETHKGKLSLDEENNFEASIFSQIYVKDFPRSFPVQSKIPAPQPANVNNSILVIQHPILFVSTVDDSKLSNQPCQPVTMLKLSSSIVKKNSISQYRPLLPKGYFSNNASVNLTTTSNPSSTNPCSMVFTLVNQPDVVSPTTFADSNSQVLPILPASILTEQNLNTETDLTTNPTEEDLRAALMTSLTKEQEYVEQQLQSNQIESIIATRTSSTVENQDYLAIQETENDINLCDGVLINTDFTDTMGNIHDAQNGMSSDQIVYLEGPEVVIFEKENEMFATINNEVESNQEIKILQAISEF